MTRLRSLLFVPGNRPDMLEKALGLSPDVYVPDMEDSVPEQEKQNARSVIASFLPRLHATGTLVIPRVNAMNTGLLEDDLAAIVGPDIDGVSVGKILNAQDVQHIDDILTALEQKAGLATGRIKLLLWIETAMAVVKAYEICSSRPRIIAVAFGAEDFTDDMDIPRTETDAEIAYARSSICVAARAAGVVALDTPYFGFRDPDGLRQDALTARQCGFKGKFAIHPAQIQAINAAFSPSAAEIEQAGRIVAAFEDAERSGRGATSLDGKVIDVPVVKRARALLAHADKHV